MKTPSAASYAGGIAGKGVETILIQIVTAAKAKATLCDVVGTLTSQAHLWQLAFHGHDGSQSVAPLVSMLRL